MKTFFLVTVCFFMPLLLSGPSASYEVYPPFQSDEVLPERRPSTEEFSEDEIFSKEEDLSIRSVIGESVSDRFDIPIVLNEAVEYFIRYFTTTKRKVFSNWLKRSERYIPMMREILKENGLPEDLVYMAMIESGFNPRAYSPAKACGPWQFIYETGRRYGLRVDYWVDERRDPEKSTVAAARYLRDLFNQFGCWYLAAASYNVGEKKVERVVEQHNTRDFWELAKYKTLPRETREYIPKLIAAAIIAKNPEQFGFENISYDNPIEFLRVKVPKATRIDHISQAANVDQSVIRALNPEILRGITPPDREIVIRLPTHVELGTFEERLNSIISSGRKLAGYFPYRVRKADTLSKISQRYGVPKEEICAWNSEKSSFKVKPGRLIYIPVYENGKSVVAKAQVEPRLTGQKTHKKGSVNKRIVYYRVKKGDTLHSIARRYGVDVDSIRALNGLRGERIVAGQRLKIPVSSEYRQFASRKESLR